MADRFEVGEMAIYYYPESAWHLTGVRIVMDRHRASWKGDSTGETGKGWGYEVEWPDSTVTFQLETELRKRRPPRDWVKLCRLTGCSDEIPA